MGYSSYRYDSGLSGRYRPRRL